MVSGLVTGLGHSVQKLSYLPEAALPTFMLAVLGEEFGFFGVSVVDDPVIYHAGMLYPYRSSCLAA